MRYFIPFVRSNKGDMSTLSLCCRTNFNAPFNPGHDTDRESVDREFLRKRRELVRWGLMGSGSVSVGTERMYCFLKMRT